MNITSCSASAIKSYQWCIFQYYLNYILKIKTRSGKAATMGNIVHETIEQISLLKKKNKVNVDPYWLFNRNWEYQENLNPEIRMFTSRGESADYKKCKQNLSNILNDEYYTPYNMDILDVEEWFDISFPGEEFLTSEGKQFNVRGFMDIVRRIDKDTIEIIDWKNGVQLTNNFKRKEFIDLLKDIQAKIYYFAATLLYPQYKNILITFYFTEYIEPITLTFSVDDTGLIIGDIYSFFNRVKNNKLITRTRNFKCRMCPFSKNNICDKIWIELATDGQDFLKEKYYQVKLENINGE